MSDSHSITAEKQRPARLAHIDGLRAVACFIVIVCHVSILAPLQFHLSIGDHSFLLTSSRWVAGYLGVNLFLVLSGFCLYLPFAESRQDPSQLDVIGFYRRRILRLVPPYFVASLVAALLAIAFLHVAQGHQSFQSKISPFHNSREIWHWLLVQLLCLQTTLPSYFDRLLGQTWFIPLQLGCYFIFPPLAVAFKKLNPRLLLFFLLLFSAGYRWLIVYTLGLDPSMWSEVFPLANNIFGRCFEFAAGMFAARCLIEWDNSNRCPLQFWDILLLLCSLPIFLQTAHQPGSFIRLTPFFDASWGVFFFFVLVLGTRLSLIHRFLSNPVLVWAGSVSYSTYLVHVHILSFVFAAFQFNQWPFVFALFFEFLILVPLCFGAGYVFYRLFEKPFLPRRKSLQSGQPGNTPLPV